MKDLVQFQKMLNSETQAYFHYWDCNSVGDNIDYIVMFKDGITIFYKFFNQKYDGFSIEKEYKSLSEIVAEFEEK